jgi:hypothetical protein
MERPFLALKRQALFRRPAGADRDALPRRLDVAHRSLPAGLRLYGRKNDGALRPPHAAEPRPPIEDRLDSVVKEP